MPTACHNARHAQAQPTVSATATRACRPCCASRVTRSRRERRLAAEQMRAAGDVEHQPVRRIEPDQRRIAVAPVGDRFEQTPVGLRIGIRDRQARIHRARIGERHAGLEAEPRRGVVQGGDPQRALDRRDDDKGFSRRGRAARDPVGRKPPQPHRQIAPAESTLMMVPLDDPAAGAVRGGSCEAKGRNACGRGRRKRRAGSARRRSASASPPRSASASVRWRSSRPRPESRADAVARGEREPARRGEIGRRALAGQFGDDAGERAALQRLLHRPQHIDRARHAEHQQPRRGQAEQVEAGAVGRAGLACREIGGDPEHLAAVARSRAPRARGQIRWRRRDAAAPRGQAHAARRRQARRRAPHRSGPASPIQPLLASEAGGDCSGRFRQGLAEMAQRGLWRGRPMGISLVCSCFVLMDSRSPPRCQAAGARISSVR